MSNSAQPKVLYLVHRVPYPPDKGDRIRNYHILTWLARRASVHLACLADESVEDSALATLEGLADRVAVVRLGRGSRSLRAARSFAMGRTVSEGAFRSPEMSRLLRCWVGATRYNVILASASSLAPYLRLEELRNMPAVVDFVDVDSQKWLDYAKTSSGSRAWLYSTEGRRLQRFEHDVTRWARGVVLVSQAETNLFGRSSDATNVYTVPNGVDLTGFQTTEEVVGSDRTCVFVGALDYRPNIDGVSWFCQDVWPEIRRQREGARLLLVGRRPVPAVRRLASVPGVEVVGQVPDVRPYLAQAAVVVVPLRLARGVQNKVLEAMAMGKATVASPQSLAGLPARGAVPALTASTPSEWVDAVIGLMDDPERRRRLGSRRSPIRRRIAPLGSLPGTAGSHPRTASTHRPVRGRLPGVKGRPVKNPFLSRLDQSVNSGGVVSIATDVLDEVEALPDRPDQRLAGCPPVELQVTVIEHRPGWQVVDVRRALAVSRAAVLPDLARRQGPVQADGPGRRLGDPPAAGDDAGLQPVLRPSRRRIRRALCPTRCSCWRGWFPGCSSPTRSRRPVRAWWEPEPGHQDLLSPPDHPHGGGWGRPGRLGDRLCHAADHDGLVRRRARRGRSLWSRS